MSIFFIVGMPRSGTTYMSSLLNSQKSIVSTGETLYWGRQFIQKKSNFYHEKEIEEIKNYLLNLNLDNVDKEKKDEINNIIKEHFEKIIPPASPKVIFDIFSDSIKKVFQKKIFIEKTPHHVQYHERILEYYPKTKFIVMMRNPYDFVLSYKFQGSQKNNIVRSIFDKIYHPIAATLVWRRNYVSIKKLNKSYPKKVFLIRNESLGDQTTLIALQNFLDIPEIVENKGTRFSSFEKFNKKPELEPVDIFWINSFAKSYILDANYQLIKSDVKLIEIIKSIYSIIPTLYAIFKLIPTRTNKFIYFLAYFKKK